MIFDQFIEIKNEYYELREEDGISEETYDKLKAEYLKLDIKVSELHETDAEDRFAYVLTDPECEDPAVVILKNDNRRDLYLEKIADAIGEYYSYCSFHDEITGLNPKDLIMMVADEYKIPIVAYYDCADMLNVRWLCSICE